MRVPAGTFSRPRGGFARRAGALTAVFPRSVYVPGGGGGLIPVIPPGTIFHLGDPAPAGRAPASRHLSPNYADLLVPAGAQGARDLRLDERRDTLIGAAEPAPAGASDDSEGAGTPSVFTDDGYRARRLDDLIRAAAATPAADAPTP
ncbi:MAG TPA: hypothetical protein VD963_07685 [Phycisphaerales bacterium]|nr:hypothetical protein [Phycisphaerales bacterium]